MRKKYKEELNQSLPVKQDPATIIIFKQRRRPLLLGDLDDMVQNYLRVQFSVLVKFCFCEIVIIFIFINSDKET